MQTRQDEDYEFHVPPEGRSLEEIARRLEEMQRELDARLPVAQDDDDGEPDAQDAG